MTDWLSLEEVADLVESQSTLALGGLSLYRRPIAFIRALLQKPQPPQKLTLLSFTCGYGADLMVGAGCIESVRTVYFGLEAFGLAPMFTHHANRGSLTIVEETETSLVMGLRARVMGVGSLPATAWQGTSLFDLRPDVQTIVEPYTGDSLTAFPAVSVDVCVLHALEADEAGNVAINNNLAIDQLLVYASDVVIVTAEKRVPQIKPAPHKTIIPATGIDYIALAEKGAMPTSCYPLYSLCGRELVAYSEKASSADGFQDYLGKWLAES